MKRIFGAILVIFLAVALFPVHSTSAQSANNFRISDYSIDYELSRDSEGRSVLKTTETITAIFPKFVNQNHGLERAIPTTYDNHSVGLKIEEVKNLTDGSGTYSTNTKNGMKILRIGDADEYVHGEQTYRIVYTQHDVTRLFNNTGRDEWYWDTNGTEWRVPIEQLRVTMSLIGDLADKQAGEPFCYRGLAGDTTRCSLDEGEKGVFTVITNQLARGENITVAFGFEQGTFAPYKKPWWEIALMVWFIIQAVTFVIAIVAIIIASIMYYRRSNRTTETDPIAAEYIPPKNASVIVAASVTSTPTTVFTAQLIDLAVRRFISIIETREKTIWRTAEYDIAIEKELHSLREEELEIISDMFGHVPSVGERLALSSLTSNMTYRARTLDNDKKLNALIESTYELRHKDDTVSKQFSRWAVRLIIFAVLLLSIPLAVASGIIALIGATLRPLTDKGLELRRYVLGLDKYIKASETERLAFLQGPETAQKVGYAVDASNAGQMVKLYERVLPYAILFGREKEWAKQLGNFYQQSDTSPTWYSGPTAFNAAVFASALGNFSQAAAYSGGSSSSSGGSSGGGSSGGGGGGGGGGGW